MGGLLGLGGAPCARPRVTLSDIVLAAVSSLHFGLGFCGLSFLIRKTLGGEGSAGLQGPALSLSCLLRVPPPEECMALPSHTFLEGLEEMETHPDAMWPPA